MEFIQIVEYRTSRPEDVRSVMDRWLEATEGQRLATSAVLCRDRDASETYVELVRFPSAEDAARNSDMPQTGEFASQLAKLCDGEPTFRDLDVIEDYTEV